MTASKPAAPRPVSPIGPKPGGPTHPTPTHPPTKALPVLAPDLMAEVDLLLYLDGAQALGVEMRAELAAAFEVAGRNAALVASALDLVNAAMRKLAAIHTPARRDDAEAASSVAAAQPGGPVRLAVVPDREARAGAAAVPGAGSDFTLPPTPTIPSFGNPLR